MTVSTDESLMLLLGDFPVYAYTNFRHTFPLTPGTRKKLQHGEATGGEPPVSVERLKNRKNKRGRGIAARWNLVINNFRSGLRRIYPGSFMDPNALLPLPQEQILAPEFNSGVYTDFAQRITLQQAAVVQTRYKPLSRAQGRLKSRLLLK